MPVKFVCLDDYESQKSDWLWENRIPLGALTLIEGNPGQCKSTITYDIGARLSAGRFMPFSDKPLSAEPVLFLQGEDRLGRLNGKLIAAGADTGRIFAPDRSFELDAQLILPDCLDDLEKQIAKCGAKLVVIDPMAAYFQGNLSQDQSVRKVLTPLSNLAEKRGIAIILVRHLTKNESANVLYRGAGSMGIIGAARSALLIARNPAHPTQRVLIQTKSSWGEISESLVFDLTQAGSDARIDWIGTSSHTADEVLEVSRSIRSELEEAMYFLYSVLGEGPLAVGEVKSLARCEGISMRTLRRAKEALQVDSKRVGFGPRGRVYWVLSDESEVVERFRQRDLDELSDKLCHGPTDVDLADKRLFSMPQPRIPVDEDSADWRETSQPADDDDENPEPDDPTLV